MPIQFPASRRIERPMDIANRDVSRGQMQTNNALVNDAQRMQNMGAQTEYDDDQKLKVARAFKVISERGAKMLQQDPNSYANWMPDMMETMQELGLRTDRLPPAGSSSDAVMEGLTNMNQMADDIMAALGPQGPLEEDPRQSTSQIRNENYRAQRMASGDWTQQDQDRFDASVRAPKYGDIAGVPSQLGAGGESTQLSTQDAELDYVQQEARRKEMGSRGGQPTTAQEKIDTAYAPEYVAFTQGGYQDAVKGIEQLGTVQAELNQPDVDLTGWKIASQPDIMLAVRNPEALQAREQVEEVVQRNLRLILGAQFTEKEGVRLIARAYNPWMDEKYNAIRINRLVKSISEAMNAKVAAAKFYEANQTLAGFESKIDYSMSDFYDVLDDQTELKVGDVYNGRTYLGGNPNKRSSWK